MTATIVTEGLARWYGRVIGLIEADLTFEPGVTGQIRRKK